MRDDIARVVGPREWVGTAEFPWPPVDALAGGAMLVACFSVVSLQRDVTKGGKSYYKLQLSDRHGTIEARVWDPVIEVMERICAGAFVGIRGIVELYNGSRQLKVTEILPIRVAPEDLDLFLPRSPRDPEAMEAELAALIASVTDDGLRLLLERLLDPESEIGRRFRQAPAAKQNHHAYVGGLLEHTLSIAAACSLMAEHYWPAVDRDLLVAGALLHDVGKVREIGTQAGFPYTDEGKLLGHILLGLQMVADVAKDVPELSDERLMLLQHLVASHQGRYEWQSPREPRILEGLILHYCDDLDAKMNQALGLIAGVERGWTPHDRAFGRDFMRHVPGAAAGSGKGNHRNATRRTVKFAGRLHVAPDAEAKTDGALASREAKRPKDQKSEVAEPLEALPPRPITPLPDALPPDPNSLDLFG